ncbi:MAG: hybrid sensor histidine kinase/response regulator [Elusimicrobiales bacterium]
MTKARILIVDDDAHLRETLQDLLEMEGYQVTQAANGAQAMNCVAAEFFEIILMDFNLPDKTGIDISRDIRRLNQDSQILMMTAHASLDTAVRAIQESVYDFLIKPVDFSYLKRAIRKALEKLRLEQDIRGLVAELQKKNEELTRLSDMKSKFLSMSSHDLSNSLMTLQISFEMLVSDIKPSEDQQKKIVFIVNGISQISRLINDLVDWASIEQGKFRLEKNYFSVATMVSELIEGPRARASQKDISVNENILPGMESVMVCADRRRLTQVLLNLLENAVRHTPRGGAITVTVEPAGADEVSVSVRDSGEGIDPVVLPKLFRSFYQGEPGGSSQKGRLGLGLSIAKEIITSHSGRIWVESEGSGKGAAFNFTLPAASAAEDVNAKEGSCPEK